MKKKIDWSKAPEGTTHFCHDAIDGSHWRDFSDTYAKYWHSGEWHDHNGARSAALLSSSVRFEARPAAPTWPADGVLPPVGIECERMWSSGPATYTRVRVIAHDAGQAIYRFLGDRREGEVQADAQGPGDQNGNPIFRPIRTTEQIAAEEREKALDEMTDCTSLLYASLATRRAIAAELYDAGYRKQ